MKKNIFFIGLSILFAMSLTAFTPADKDIDPVGTWTFSAPDAPYDYQSGDFIITKEKKEYKVQVVFNEYYKMKASNVKYEKNELSFRVYVDDETVYIKGTFDKEKGFVGKAMTSMGDMPIKAKKKVIKKDKK
ncbi:MAG: hypothetical protein HN352_10560 [Bacteroidetes bacterium]|jgi:hypothetical protein|nr:hypothetical protein [Bacteroidota bacterium]MBT3747608.1 hypothetical protein [Bacteroidota bacterium]MBT4398473.1 hypothetical protein [Bacteroidota bacterium]MBT4409232.1 hypothetical protein [Bacteroidota bacterium]MBT5427600.1 hypothetical protein [Bacteroidota bacterium]